MSWTVATSTIVSWTFDGCVATGRRLATGAPLFGLAGAAAKRGPITAADGAFFGLGGDVDAAAGVVLPQGGAAVAEAQQAGVEAGEVLGHVLQVALQDGGGVVVAAGVDDLGEVDQRGSIFGDEDVEGREVAVDAARAQQEPHLPVDLAVQERRDIGRKIEVGEAGCGGAVVVDEELHEEHVFVEQDGLGDADAGVVRVGEGLVLHVAPRGLDELTAVGGALAHRAFVAAVASLVAALDVVGGGFERAVLAVFVDLGGDKLALSLHDPDRGLFARHEAGADVVDDAVVKEASEAVGQVHWLIVSEPRARVYTAVSAPRS